MSQPDFVEKIGLPLLAHRLRRMSDAIVHDVGALLNSRDVGIPPRAGSLVLLLSQCHELPIMVASEHLRLSHPMIISLAHALSAAGLVEDVFDPHDSRRRLLRLTKKGRQQARFLGDLNRALSGAFEQIFQETGADLFAALQAFEEAAAKQPIFDRVAALLDRTGREKTPPTLKSTRRPLR
jgi:DNA-binding MarR family transcriptional regulator